MKKFLLLLIMTVCLNTTCSAAELIYNEYDTYANIKLGIDFSKFRILTDTLPITVDSNMISNYDPYKIGRQIVSVTYEDETFQVPIFLTQQPPSSMTPDGYIHKSDAIITTDTLTETMPNEVIQVDATVSDSAIVVPCYTGADGKEYRCYMFKEQDNKFYIYGNRNLEYYTKEVKPDFTDMSDQWYVNNCIRLYKAGIMTGTSIDTFSPDDMVTRAQACRILYKLAGQPRHNYDGRYLDVPRTSWFASSVFWYYNDVLQSTRTYVNPDFCITRDEMASMIYNALDLSMLQTDVNHPPLFKDLDKAVNKEAIIKLQQLGIVSGDTNGNYNPNNFITRAEFSTILCKYIDVYVTGRELNGSTSTTVRTDVQS